MEKPVDNVENLCLPRDKKRVLCTNYVNWRSQLTRFPRRGNRLGRGGEACVVLVCVLVGLDGAGGGSIGAAEAVAAPDGGETAKIYGNVMVC